MAQVVECSLSMQKGVPSPVPQKLNQKPALFVDLLHTVLTKWSKTKEISQTI
jgi:hypothetical protein